MYVVGALSTSANVCVALFKDTTADAIASVWSYNVAQAVIYRLRHRMASPGFIGGDVCGSGVWRNRTFYVNGNSSGTRVGGGVLARLHPRQRTPDPTEATMPAPADLVHQTSFVHGDGQPHARVCQRQA